MPFLGHVHLGSKDNLVMAARKLHLMQYENKGNTTAHPEGLNNLNTFHRPGETTQTRRLVPGGGGCTLILSYIRRLGPFFGVQNFEFQYFLVFQKNENFLGYEDCVGILFFFFFFFFFGGGGGVVITKLDYIYG